MCRTTEKDPRQGNLLRAWMGRATEKDWPKRPSDSQRQGGLKKESDRAVTPAVEAGCIPAHLARPSSCATFTLNSHQGRAATGRRILASVHAGSLRWSPTLCDPVANTGCHTLLEHCISYCPSCQLPWVPGAARAPATQAAAPPPHLALTGANPSPPGQPQEQIPVDDPHVEVGIKPQLKPRGC